MTNVRAGQRITSKSTYQARSFLLPRGEEFPPDASSFDRAAHAPRLLQIEKGQAFDVLGLLPNGQVFVRVESDGKAYACLLLPDSFQG
jgi:hypothetical protein